MCGGREGEVCNEMKEMTLVIQSSCVSMMLSAVICMQVDGSSCLYRRGERIQTKRKRRGRA